MTFVTIGEALDKGRGISIAHEGVQCAAEVAARAALKRAALLELPMPSAHRHLDNAKRKISKHLSACESPIERLMLPALVMANYGHAFASFPAELHVPAADSEPPRGDLLVIPQFAIIRYRMDFAVIATAEGQRKIVCVECDGEDFHKDANKDRGRDNYLRAFGIETFRFCGSDIQADPLPLAATVASHIADWRASL